MGGEEYAVVSSKPGQEAPCLICSHDLPEEYQEPELDLALFFENLNRDGNFGDRGDLVPTLAFKVASVLGSTVNRFGSSVVVKWLAFAEPLASLLLLVCPLT